MIIHGKVTNKRLVTIAKNLWVNQQICLRLLRATTMFRFIRKPNTKSGGRSGSTLVKDEPFICEPCFDLQRINTVEGGTRYGIIEKLFENFTGYLIDWKEEKLTMVSASVKCLQPKYGSENDITAGFVESMMEGPTIQKIRWADVDDVWNDETMTKRLYKYLKAYGVHEKYLERI